MNMSFKEIEENHKNGDLTLGSNQPPKKKHLKSPGRPKLDVMERVNKLKVYLEDGLDFKAACIMADVGKSAIEKVKKEDPAVQNLIDYYMGKTKYEAVKGLSKKIQEGDLKAMTFYLERKHSDEYGANIKQTVKQEKEISQEALAEMSMEDLMIIRGGGVIEAEVIEEDE